MIYYSSLFLYITVQSLKKFQLVVENSGTHVKINKIKFYKDILEIAKLVQSYF
jgi:hypothetical protein